MSMSPSENVWRRNDPFVFRRPRPGPSPGFTAPAFLTAAQCQRSSKASSYNLRGSWHLSTYKIPVASHPHSGINSHVTD